MRAISFMCFKQHCSYSDYPIDGHENKPICAHPGHQELSTLAIVDGVKYSYHRCCEKQCPVMQSCKEIDKC